MNPETKKYRSPSSYQVKLIDLEDPGILAYYIAHNIEEAVICLSGVGNSSMAAAMLNRLQIHTLWVEDGIYGIQNLFGTEAHTKVITHLNALNRVSFIAPKRMLLENGEFYETARRINKWHASMNSLEAVAYIIQNPIVTLPQPPNSARA